MVIKRQCVYTLTYDTEVMYQLQCKLCCLPAGASQNDEEFTVTEEERETHYPHIVLVLRLCVPPWRKMVWSR